MSAESVGDVPAYRAGRRTGPAARGAHLVRLGPAFVAAIAYVDPGNVATNTTAGAQYGFGLAWVVVLAIAVAGPVQYLSAKLGAITGSSLPELLGARMSPASRFLYWLQAEAVIIATDLAEVVGAAIALHLLFGMPMWQGAIVTAVVGGALLIVRDRAGDRCFQLVMIGGLALIGAGFVLGVAMGPAPAGVDLRPQLHDQQMVLLATGIVGATVMPHAIYLHSSLTTQQGGTLRKRLRTNRIDVVLAMVLAGSVNVCMLVLGATALRGNTDQDFSAIAHSLGTRIGDGAETAFALALLVSGLASTTVGIQSGEVVMSGLLHRRIPVLARRAGAVIPAVALLALGTAPVSLLVWSQVVLALGLPFALIPLVRLTSSRSVMGSRASRRGFAACSWSIIAAVVALDLGLLAIPLVSG
ncbi:Nramp family divalent metal transporter [Flexivirga caeni]|uniref:Nramp family divalent metal transporter n=1 Tax=Flexivirga caeni TaxID=2294115 RepID=UPI001FE6D903|nr:Nramp family divalent metal transporter [Flexivirga caeni]